MTENAKFFRKRAPGRPFPVFFIPFLSVLHRAQWPADPHRMFPFRHSHCPGEYPLLPGHPGLPEDGRWPADSRTPAFKMKIVNFPVFQIKGNFPGTNTMGNKRIAFHKILLLHKISFIINGKRKIVMKKRCPHSGRQRNCTVSG